MHASADGIAFGAAASGSNHSLELIVYLAIMLHKAPSSFGLSSFLLHEGHTRKVTQKTKTNKNKNNKEKKEQEKKKKKRTRKKKKEKKKKEQQKKKWPGTF